jgi:Zn-finger nucleic acid-binding protein
MHGNGEQNTRLCPDCRSTLKPETFQGIELDICEICAGIWFDMGELRRLMDSEERSLIKTEDCVKPTTDSRPKRSDLPRLCPRCRLPMSSHRYMHVSFIWLEGCERCSGIWVEEGELQQIEEWLVNREQFAASRPEHLLAVDQYEQEHVRQVDQKRIMAHMMRWLKMRARLR